MAGARQYRDEHEFAGCRPIGKVRIDMASCKPDQCAAEAGGNRSKHVGDVQYARDRRPEILDADLIGEVASPMTPAGSARSGAAPSPRRWSQ